MAAIKISILPLRGCLTGSIFPVDWRCR